MGFLLNARKNIKVKQGFFSSLAVLTLFCFGAYAEPPAAPPSPPEWAYYLDQHLPPTKWDTFVEQGLTAMESGDLQKGAIWLERAINEGCNDGIVHLELALYFESLRNTRKAHGHYEAALTQWQSLPPNPIRDALYPNYGRFLFSINELDKSFSLLHEAATRGSAGYDSYFLMGQIARFQKDPVRALVYFDKAIALLPPTLAIETQAGLYREAARVAFEVHNTPKSKELWEKVESLLPKDKEATEFLKSFSKKSH